MPIDRRTLYRLPWSRTDNPGGWIEVTDACDFSCPGCYRHTLTGHRELAELEAEIETLERRLHCDRIAIAGGEPLLSPHIVDVVCLIARRGLKPVLLTNGERLTPELGRELQRAGLAKFHFHVDSGMQRPGWENKTEAEMNELRQHFADLVWELDGVQCGYNITIFPSTLRYLPDIVEWARRNLHKVQHLSLIAFRSIPLDPRYEYRVNGAVVDAARFQHATAALDRLTVTSDAMLDVLHRYDPGFRPSCYLRGSSAPGTYKFLIAVQVGSSAGLLGYLGPRTVACVQVAHHLLRGRYCAFLRNARVGPKVLAMALIDPQVRRLAGRLLRHLLCDPRGALAGIYTQSVSLQQPNEMLDGQANLCDGCLNMMLYGDQLIPSCRLDEYRLFGGPLTPVRVATTASR
jgi:hypothetical protein